MTLRLTLVRHAKSSWDDPLVDDHDRRLNERGLLAATAIGAWIKENKYCAETVYSSTARRTVETWAGISAFCSGDADVQFSSSLYLASPDRMLTMLQGARTSSVMMIAHNPGTASLAEGLCNTAPIHPKFFTYPSGAVTVIEFDFESWAEITPHTGNAINFIVPKELI